MPDYIGAFVVTAGIGEDIVADRFKNANDDYSSILCKALADRLAEAFAERMHARVRREFWGYAPDEAFAPDELIWEKYAASAPRPAIPRSPITPKRRRCLRCSMPRTRLGVKLTESFRDVAGLVGVRLYFSHAESFYFGVGKIERDQVEDYARAQELERRGSRALAGAGVELHPDARPVRAGPPRQGSHANAGAGGGCPRQRCRIQRIDGASAGLNSRGASGVRKKAARG